MYKRNPLRRFISWMIKCFDPRFYFRKKNSRHHSKNIVLGHERRRCARLKTHNLMRVLNVNDQPSQEMMNLIDLSETGFQFQNKSRYPANTVLRVIINVRQINQQIPMKVRLVWSHPIRLKVVWNQPPAGRRHVGTHAGASILEMAEEDRLLLKEYIHSKIDVVHASAA